MYKQKKKWGYYINDYLMVVIEDFKNWFGLKFGFYKNF